MERSSYFIKNKAMFGSFPTQEAVQELEEKGVRYFVNLTQNHEKKITPYDTKYNKINFPIVDRRIPNNWREYACFIIKISDIINNLKNNELIYIHCKGGHGRSGIVVASLLCYMFKLTPEKALEQTRKSHGDRVDMREKWRKLGSPQTFFQKNFIYKFFNNLIFFRTCSSEIAFDFSSYKSVNTDIVRIVCTAEDAIQEYKNKDYITENEQNDINNYDNLFYKVIKLKFDQRPEILEKLLNTGLRPITYCKKDNFCTNNHKITNSLMIIREEKYRESI